MMESIKEFAEIAGYIIGIMAVALLMIVGTVKVIGKVREKRKPDAQYTHQDATRELDAWESGDDFETRGGIDEQKAWGDDHIDEDPVSGSDIEEGLFDADDEPTETPSAEPDYTTEEDQTTASESTPAVEEAQIEATSTPEQSPEPETQQPPSEAPPLPSGGLPEGWTTEQWRWYGHQWLERHGGN